MPVSLYDPRTMMGVVKSMPPVQTYLKDTFFKKVKPFDTKHVDVDFYKGKRKVAPFVHPRIGGKTVENSGYKTEIFTPALVAPDKITTTDDLMHRLPGESLYGGMSPDERAQIKFAEDLAELDEMITRREEVMCAQAIFTGQIPVIGEGLDQVIDFNFTNKETLSGTDLFSDPNSDPIGWLEKWHRQIQIKGHKNADVVVMAWDVVNEFINHPKVKDLLDTRNLNIGAVDFRELPNGVTYVGRITKLGLDIYQYNEWYLDDWTDENNPVEKPMVPDGTLAMLSTRAQYSMAYGAVTLIKDESFITVEGPRVPDSWVQKKPAARFVQVSSKPLPIPHEVDSWFVAKVL
jgi:hypothetical protein